MKIQRFEDLEIWNISIDLTKEIYTLTNEKYFRLDFGLKDQLRRAAVSISSNIAEGFERNNNNEFIRFLKISKGSAGEVRSQLYVARGVGFIDLKQFDSLNEKLLSLSNQIGEFIGYLENARRDKKFLFPKIR